MKKISSLILIFIMTILMIPLTSCGKAEAMQPSSTQVTAAKIVTPAPTPSPTPTPTPIPTPTPLPLNNPNAKVKVPILYYHRVNDVIEGLEELHVKPAEFEKQMQYLKDNGYTPINFDDIDKTEHIQKPVIITFDDGYEDNYTNAYPILKKFGFKATVFVVANFVDNPSILTKNEMKEMSDLISFQSHTLSHPDLRALKPEEAEKEISESKTKLEAITGKSINAFAYPVGYYNSSVLAQVKKYYKYAVLNGGGMYTTGENLLEMKRLYIPRWMDIQSFDKKIKGIQ